MLLRSHMEVNMTNKKRITYLILTIGFVLVEILIGLFVHDAFIRPYIGDVLVVVILYCFARIIFPDRLVFMSLFVFLFAVGVEISQYFNLVSLLGFNKTGIFGILLGATFDWIDIICYAVGCGILLFIDMTRLKNQIKS